MKPYIFSGPNRMFGALAGGAALLLTLPARAQDPAPLPGEPVAEPAPAAPPVAAEAPASEPVAPPAAEQPIATEPPPPPVAEAAPAAPAEEEAGGNGLSLSMFVDAYADWQTGEVGGASTATGHRAYASTLNGVNENGFSLSFVGFDAAYDGGEVGAKASLRFGPGVTEFFGDRGAVGIDNLTQGYLTWKPGMGPLTLDFGQFGTIFGAEVAESWKNLNYTRGALYYALQPFWHTGLRANIAFSDQFSLNLMVVDSANTVSIAETGGGIAFAAQGVLTLSEQFSLYFGGMYDTDESTAIDNFADVVAVIKPIEALSIIFNADYLGERNEGAERDHLGGSLALGYAFTEAFGLAVRGEYLSFDNGDGVDNTSLITGTATVDVKPIRGQQNLIIRWDNRIESSGDDIFVDSDNEATDTWFTTVLGVVATTDI